MRGRRDGRRSGSFTTRACAVRKTSVQLPVGSAPPRRHFREQLSAPRYAEGGRPWFGSRRRRFRAPGGVGQALSAVWERFGRCRVARLSRLPSLAIPGHLNGYLGSSRALCPRTCFPGHSVRLVRGATRPEARVLFSCVWRNWGFELGLALAGLALLPLEPPFFVCVRLFFFFLNRVLLIILLGLALNLDLPNLCLLSS
jgi:hypothetical protein